MFSKKASFVRYSTDMKGLDLTLLMQKKYVDMEGVERCIGFVDFQDRSPEFPNPVEYFRFQCVSVCVGKRNVPKKLLDKEYKNALKALEIQFEAEGKEINKTATRELRTATKLRLLRDMPAVPNYFDVVLDTLTGFLYIFSTTAKDVQETLDLFECNAEFVGYLSDCEEKGEVDILDYMMWVYKQNVHSIGKGTLIRGEEKVSFTYKDAFELTVTAAIEEDLAVFDTMEITYDNTELVMNEDQIFKNLVVAKTEMDEDMIANVNDRMAAIFESIIEVAASLAIYRDLHKED